MNIQIICIGKLKESYWVDAVKEYSKRLSRFCNLSIVELKESKLPDNSSEKDEEKVKEQEGQSILRTIKNGTYVVDLEIDGKTLDSVALAKKIQGLGVNGISDVAFIIGGSLGLSEEVSMRADMKLSFSAMTFPHQMMRVILLEQIYRAFKINNNETYHK